MRPLLPQSFSTLTSMLLLAACSTTTTTTADLEGTPELAAIELAVTAEPTTEGLATEADAVDVQGLAADELEQTQIPESTDAKDLSQIRSAVKELNGALREALTPVVSMVRNDEPSQTWKNLQMWGPVTRGATEYRFFLRHSAAHRWGWRLEARVADSTDAYERVAAGTIAVDSTPRRGAGAMGFDFDAWSTVDPTVTAQGRILLGFKHGSLGTSVGYALRDFSYDADAKPPVDALLRGVHLKSGMNRVRLAYHGNVEGTATDAEELVLARVRHQADLGGRSDLVVLGGDIPTDGAWVISQCWDADLNNVFRAVRSCPLDGIGGDNCTVTETTGDNAQCPAKMAAAELAPVDANAEMADDSDPNSDVAAPSEIPEVAGN